MYCEHTLFATSSASWSEVNRTYAFFLPSGLGEISLSCEAPVHVNSPDECVDLRGLDVVQLLDGILDLTLIRLDINDEDQGVVLLNLLHRRLRVQRSSFSVNQTFLRTKLTTHETIVLNWSIRGAWGTDLRGYLGSRESRRVLGRWKETEVRFLVFA